MHNKNASSNSTYRKTELEICIQTAMVLTIVVTCNQGLKKSWASWERKFPRATFLANPWPYSSFNLAEMVLNPTLTPSTHSKIHPIKYQASNIEHCIINKNCRYIWSKLKLRKARNYPEIRWVKKGLYRAQFTNVKFAVHDKRH